MTLEQAYELGDLDNDFDNDLNDFILFFGAYEFINGEGSFTAALTVPEPSSCLLACFCSIYFLAYRLRSKRRFGLNAL